MTQRPLFSIVSALVLSFQIFSSFPLWASDSLQDERTGRRGPAVRSLTVAPAEGEGENSCTKIVMMTCGKGIMNVAEVLGKVVIWAFESCGNLAKAYARARAEEAAELEARLEARFGRKFHSPWREIANDGREERLQATEARLRACGEILLAVREGHFF